MVYSDCKVYGPYTSKQDGRKRVVIVDQNGIKKTVSYPKYLMECYLDRYLFENETVDHIDYDFTNDEISNLRVVDRKTHCSEDALRVKPMSFNCPTCCVNFFVACSSKQAQIRRDRKNNRAGPFCSKSCAGKYAAYLQNNKIQKTEVKNVGFSEKYRLKAL